MSRGHGRPDWAASRTQGGRPSGGGPITNAIGNFVRGLMGKDSFTPGQAQGAPQGGKPVTPAPGQAPGAPGTPGAAPAGAPKPGVAAPQDDVPYINQHNPAGKDANYLNADQNCGPAVMAMLARKFGKGAGLDDADLISQLGKIGGTDATGTSGNGLIAMAQEMGLPTAAKQGADAQWVMSQLAQGKEVIANGDFFAIPQHADANQTSPHYLLLTGVDQNGNILAKDPADASVRSITPGQLEQFNRAHPDGGFNISVG